MTKCDGSSVIRAPKSEQISLHLLLRSLLFGMQAAHVTRVAPVKEAVGLGTLVPHKDTHYFGFMQGLKGGGS